MEPAHLSLWLRHDTTLKKREGHGDSTRILDIKQVGRG
jgi:hypothetical protein